MSQMLKNEYCINNKYYTGIEIVNKMSSRILSLAPFYQMLNMNLREKKAFGNFLRTKQLQTALQKLVQENAEFFTKHIENFMHNSKELISDIYLLLLWLRWILDAHKRGIGKATLLSEIENNIHVLLYRLLIDFVQKDYSVL